MADNLVPAPAEDVLAAAIEALQAGRPLFAAQFAEAALAVRPNHAQAMQVLLAAHRAAGALAPAEAAARRCLELNPDDIWAVIELSQILLSAGRLPEAELYARHAVRAAPRAAAAHNALGMVLTETRQPVPAEHHYRRVLALGGQRDPVVLANLAWNLKTQGRMAEARAAYRNAVTVAPSMFQAWLGWARLEAADRDFAGAEQKLGQAERLAPGDPAVLHARAALLAGTGRTEEALTLYERLGQFSRAALMEKGRLLDSLGEYDGAWTAWMAARSGGQKEDPAAQTAQLAAFFTPAQMDTLPRATPRPESPSPVFLLGFPRSGTALLEQMLACHPGIEAGGALPVLPELVAKIPTLLGSPNPYPTALAELFMGDQAQGLDMLRDFYLLRAAQFGAGRGKQRKFTDRRGLNETHLALLTLLFPQSPLIHIQRHPLDVMISLLATDPAADLATAARHYAAVDDLLTQQQGLAERRLLRLRYEDLVVDPEKSMRRVCAHVGEVFDPACLQFETRRRYIHTGTDAVLNEPLHRRGLYRYRNYDRHLAPAIDVLGATIARAGYAV
jgi:tetratricopeptide (TPR) repeat protein